MRPIECRKNAFNRVVAPVPRLPVGAGGPVLISRHQASRIAISGALPLDPCGYIGASDRRSGGFLLRQCSRSTCTSIGGAGFPVSVRVKAVRVLPRLSGIEWHGQLIAGIPASIGRGGGMPGGCLLLALEPVGVVEAIRGACSVKSISSSSRVASADHRHPRCCCTAAGSRSVAHYVYSCFTS